MPFLIVNADDFGYSPLVNAAVKLAHTEGILTSASLMVAEEGAAEAVEIARRLPSLGVGLHVSISHDRPLLPPADIPHLVAPDGRFRRDPLRAGIHYALSAAARRELQCEMAAQFERFASTRLPWSHADGHQHFHLHPAAAETFVQLCSQNGVRRVRMPREEILPHFRAGGDGPNLNTAAGLFLSVLRRRATRILVAAGGWWFVCDRVYGQLQTGDMHASYVERLLARIPEGVSEAYFHPGSPHARSGARGHPDLELQALLNPGVRASALTRGARIGTYLEAEEWRKSRDSRCAGT